MKKFIIEKIKIILTVLLVLLFILFFVIPSFISSPISLPVNKVFSRNVEYGGKEYLAIRNDNTIMLLKENGDLPGKLGCLTLVNASDKNKPLALNPI